MDKSKVELISNLPTPNTVKDVRSFLCHARFYRQFIKDFSALSLPLCNILAKDVQFVWSRDCEAAFENLRKYVDFPSNHAATKSGSSFRARV